jgi:hypothetical protein
MNPNFFSDTKQDLQVTEQDLQVPEHDLKATEFQDPEGVRLGIRRVFA